MSHSRLLLHYARFEVHLPLRSRIHRRWKELFRLYHLQYILSAAVNDFSMIITDESLCHNDASNVDGKCVCDRGFVGNGAFCCPISEELDSNTRCPLKIEWYLDFGDMEAALGDTITLRFNTACLGQYVRFETSFQWFHRGSSSPINESNDSPYILRTGNKDLVIDSIKKRQLGQYTVRFTVDRYGPYEVSARIDLIQRGGSCRKLLVLLQSANIRLNSKITYK